MSTAEATLATVLLAATRGDYEATARVVVALRARPTLAAAVLPWLEALATGAPHDDLLDLPLDVARDCAAVLADAHPPLREELRGLLAELVYEAGDELMVVAS